MRSELLKGSLDLLLLAILADGPTHGYAVVAELRRRSDGTFDLPEGTIYPALHRLEAAGLLSSRWSTESGRRRRVYSVSRRGRAALGERRSEWQDFTSAVAEVIA
jgi:transcriptional regulator